MPKVETTGPSGLAGPSGHEALRLPLALLQTPSQWRREGYHQLSPSGQRWANTIFFPMKKVWASTELIPFGKGRAAATPLRPNGTYNSAFSFALGSSDEVAR